MLLKAKTANKKKKKTIINVIKAPIIMYISLNINVFR